MLVRWSECCLFIMLTCYIHKNNGIYVGTVSSLIKSQINYSLFELETAIKMRENKPIRKKSNKVLKDLITKWRIKTWQRHCSHSFQEQMKILAQFEEFVDFYGIKEGDGMYIAPKDRLAVW